MSDNEVLITPFEALRIAAGHPMTCKDSTGASVVVRLFTPDEFIAANKEAVNETLSFAGDAIRKKHYVTRERAEELTKPIEVTEQR